MKSIKTSLSDLEDIIFESPPIKKTDQFKKFEKALDSFSGNISDFTSEENTLLHMVAKIEDSSLLIQKIIGLGIDINSPDNNGCTPLFEAANYECPSNCKTLLNLGADASISNSDGYTPLINAAAMGYFDCVKVLVDNGADINYYRINSGTALHLALYSEVDIELMDYLIDNGADINLGDGFATPLMSAIYSENIEMVEYIIEKGAKIKAFKDKDGRDAIEVAKKIGVKEIIDYLKSVEQK